MENKLYKLLLLIKEVEEKNLNGINSNITFKMLDLENKEALGKLVLKAENMNLIKTCYSKAKGIPSIIYWENTELTQEGIKYLEENSKFNKLYKNIKNIVDLIP